MKEATPTMSTTTMKMTDPASAEAPTVHPIETDPATDVYAEAEAKVREGRAVLAQREAEKAEAQNAEGRAIRRLMSGDDSITAEMLAGAAMAEKRADLLEKAARTALDSARRKGPHRPVVASLLAPIVQEALGCPAVVVDTIPEHSDDLVTYIRQAAPVGPVNGYGAGGGAVSCETIELVHYRSARHKDADWSSIARLAEARGIRVSVHTRGSSESDGKGEDHAEAYVRSCFPEVIRLRYEEVQEHLTTGLGTRFATLAAEKMGSRFDFRGSSPVPVPFAYGKAGSASADRRVIGTELRTVIKGSVALGANIGALDKGRAATSLKAAAEEMAGLPFPWLGRVSDFRVERIAPTKEGHMAAEYVATLTAEVA